MHNQVLIETKEAHLQKLSQEYKQIKDTLEQQLKKEERAYKLQINELEAKNVQKYQNLVVSHRRLI